MQWPPLLTAGAAALAGAGARDRKAWRVGALCTGDGAREIYAIQRQDGRICIGGCRAAEPNAGKGNSDDGAVSRHTRHALDTFLAECFPAVAASFEVEQEWSGVIAFANDGQPLVGRLASRPNLFVAAAFAGHGMPRCFGAGKALAQWLTGEADSAVHPYITERCSPARLGL